MTMTKAQLMETTARLEELAAAVPEPVGDPASADVVGMVKQ